MPIRSYIANYNRSEFLQLCLLYIANITCTLFNKPYNNLASEWQRYYIIIMVTYQLYII